MSVHLVADFKNLLFIVAFTDEVHWYVFLAVFCLVYAKVLPVLILSQGISNIVSPWSLRKPRLTSENYFSITLSTRTEGCLESFFYMTGNWAGTVGRPPKRWHDIFIVLEKDILH